jgi:glutamate-5-semialdehyde dehydrogenase
MTQSLYDRLDIGRGDKLQSLLAGVLDVRSLADPLNQCTLARRLDHGLELYRRTCPIGVLLVIFESRPEVLVQIASLALKTGNAVILKGGREARQTLTVLYQSIQRALHRFVTAAHNQMPSNDAAIKHAVQLIYDRQQVDELLSCERFIDLVIPRGSRQLVRHVQQSTRIPVLGHADGLCSIYVAADADLDKALRILVDAKCSYPAACNAVETILIDQSIAAQLMPKLFQAFTVHQPPVKMHITQQLMDLIGPLMQPEETQVCVANEKDFDTEYSDLAVAIKQVPSMQQAIQHINQHGSRHTDGIVTESRDLAVHFMQSVDSAGVYWNVSTRFADGYRYGFGAEVGVSTSKIHARGPVGLEGLLSYKYQLFGDGHCSADYGSGGEGKRKFLHEAI